MTVSDEVRDMAAEMELKLPNTDYVTIGKLMKGDAKSGTIRVRIFAHLQFYKYSIL